ncbi:hypothetical protein BC940DRAFT_307358 [Gongronella butleri]|nr:hypothetical protein BC940DRAFT_307358 [Gongronella butleri]
MKASLLDEVPIRGQSDVHDGIFSKFTEDNDLLARSDAYSQRHASVEDWEVWTHDQAADYLPDRQQPPAAFQLGIEEPKTVTLPMFAGTTFDGHFQYKRGHVYQSGVAIWGLDFVPKTTPLDTDPSTHYLALGGYRQANTTQPYDHCAPGPNSIQIVRCRLDATGDQVAPVLDLCLLHESGNVRELRWCPYGAYEETVTNATDPHALPKLGMLACCFGDGSVQILAVPHPLALRQALGLAPEDQAPVYLRVRRSAAHFALPNASGACIAWGGSDTLAIGHVTGAISVWSVAAALAHPDGGDKTTSVQFLRFSCLMHDAGVTRVDWNGRENPSVLASSANDGKTAALNINDPTIPITIFRARGLTNVALFVPKRRSFLYMDSDFTAHEIVIVEEEYKGGLILGDSKSPIMALESSPCHSFLCSTAIDGAVRLYNLYQPRRVRGGGKVYNTVYHMDYDKASGEYRYRDGVPPIVS